MKTDHEAKKNEFQTEVIEDVKRSGSEIYRISKVGRNGNSFIDLRIFYQGKEGDEFLPTRKGVVIKAASLDHIIHALECAREGIVSI